MATTPPTLELLLRLIGEPPEAAWYPRAYAQARGLPREQLDGPLNDLRLAGMIRMTEWSRETGQGYLLTPLGRETLRRPDLLQKLASGVTPARVPPEEVPEADRAAARGGDRMTTFERGEAVRNAILYPEPARFTWGLILLNTLVFAAGLLWAGNRGAGVGPFLDGRDAVTLHEMGALTGGDLAQGQWWRLLACCFLHFGVFHLGINMYSLYATGNKLESLWGRWRYLGIYLLSALGGASVAVALGPNVLLAGASGAIWGLMMSPVVWVTLNRQFLPAPMVRQWLRQWWMIVLCNVAISFLPGISATAHFAGGAVGLLASVLMHYERVGSQLVRQISTALLLLMPAVFLGVIQSSMQSDPRWVRLMEREQLRRDAELAQAFLRDSRAPMKQLNDALEQLHTDTAKLLALDLDQRDPAEVARLQQQLQSLEEGRARLDPLMAARDGEMEALAAARKAGREHLRSVEALSRRLEAVLAGVRTREFDAAKALLELRPLRREASTTRSRWEQAIGQ